MSKGHAVIGGRRFEIHDVLLVNGKIEVRFFIHGPQAPFSGPITIFGADGRGILQGKTYVIDREIPAGMRWEFQYGLIMGPSESGDEVQYL